MNKERLSMSKEQREKVKEKGAMSNEQRVKNKENKALLTMFFALCYLFFGNLFLFGQTADRLEKLLQQEQVSYKDTALLVLEASGHIDAEKQTSADDAFNIAKQRGWLPKNTAENNATRLNGLSLLVMRAFDINGGAFFSLFKNQHYAYRAMVYRGIIQGRSDPQMLVSGDLLLYTVNKAMEREQ
jgi:hypothetical protein